MHKLLMNDGKYPTEYFFQTANYILGLQESDGAIPWEAGSIVDPWDHVEAAMGLSVAGETCAAHHAFEWLKNLQHENGSWWAAYKSGKAVDASRVETNFVAYVATGVWHYYLVTQDKEFLADFWPMVKKAMAFVEGMQSPHGEIYWAMDTKTGINKDALITGCSSIYKSLECAVCIAKELGQEHDKLARMRLNLGKAIRSKPERFDRTWDSKSRYSMDWFYPVLTGIYSGSDAKKRLQVRWDEFVEPGLGCRCVADEPWVTIAESCELTMALLAAGEEAKAHALFSWLHEFRLDDGSWWTGYVFTDKVLWPDERPTWTAGAVLLAADALTSHTAAAQLFTRHAPDENQQEQSVTPPAPSVAKP